MMNQPNCRLSYLKIVSCFCGVLTLQNYSYSQEIPKEYFKLCTIADSLYKSKDYKKSALSYSSAFKVFGGKGLSNDRYHAARAWAKANYPDSAFLQLNKIALKGNYSDVRSLNLDQDLISLHSDSRWGVLVAAVQINKDKSEVNLNRTLVRILDSIHYEDQNSRLQIQDLENKYGRNSKELDDLWRTINDKDASNLKIVTTILDAHGWLGVDSIGIQGNMTLFLVIQHSNLTTQEKYLPMMREAVKKGNAVGSSLALLEDRVALGLGKKQIYGSQIGRDPTTGNWYVLPLEDPDNVNSRRKQVGLPDLEEYLRNWGLKWDVESYKKEMLSREKNLQGDKK